MMRRAGALGLFGASVLVAVACYGPTEVRVEITTDQPCIPTPLLPGDKGVLTAVTLGEARGAAPETEVSDCTPHPGGDSEIGSIVIAPSGARDARVTVQVSMTTNGRPNRECIVAENDSPPSYCILARRSFTFIEHTSRVLPIKLYGDCRGVRCPIGQTCGKGGGCRSDEVGPEDPVAKDEPCLGLKCAPGTDGGVDAEKPVSPCSRDDGTEVLATGPATDLLAGNSTHVFWISGDKQSVLYVGKKSGQPMAISPASGELTALAVDDSALWLGTPDSVQRWEIGPNGTLKLGKQWPTTGPVVKLALLADETYYATGSVETTPTLTVIDAAGTARVLMNAVGTQEFALTKARAYGIDLGATSLLVHDLPWLDAYSAYEVPILPGRFVAGRLGAAFVTCDPGPSLSAKPGIYRIDDDTNAPILVLEVEAPWNIVATPDALFYVSRVPGQSAVHRLRKDTSAPEQLTSDFTDARGLVVDETCVYYWGTQGAVSKLYASDMKPK